MVTSDAAAEASLDVEVSVGSDAMAVCGLDDVTDTARANPAKLGRDDVICALAGRRPGSGQRGEGNARGAGRAGRAMPGKWDAWGETPGERDARGA